MGQNKEEKRLAKQSSWQGIVAQEAVGREQARTAAQEDALRMQETLLGTPQQGEFNTPAGLSEFSQSLSISPGMLQFYSQTQGTSEDFFGAFNFGAVNHGFSQYLTPEQHTELQGMGGGIAQFAKGISYAASNRMADARAAYAAGNVEEARAIEAEARGMVERYWTPAAGGESARMFSWGAGSTYSEDLAREQLSSPSARTAGNLVADAVGLSKPGSTQQQQMYRRLTGDAEAAIDAGERRASRALVEERRVADRQAKMAGASFGYRNLGSERAMSAAVGRDFAREQADVIDTAAAARSQVRAEASAFVEENARAFAMSQTEWAQKWVQNQAGFRDSFNERMTNLALATAEVSGRIADRAAQMWTSWSTAREQGGGGGSSGIMSMVGTVLGAGLGIISGSGLLDFGKDETPAPTKKEEVAG